MKSLPKSAVIVAFCSIVVLAVSGLQSHGEEFEPPGKKEQAEVDAANAELGRVYQSLMSKAEPDEQKRLREAQRAWIKWRDAEAMYIARRTAEGGSALRVDYAVAQLKLINERIEVLKDYSSQALADQ